MLTVITNWLIAALGFILGAALILSVLTLIGMLLLMEKRSVEARARAHV